MLVLRLHRLLPTIEQHNARGLVPTLIRRANRPGMHRHMGKSLRNTLILSTFLVASLAFAPMVLAQTSLEAPLDQDMELRIEEALNDVSSYLETATQEELGSAEDPQWESFSSTPLLILTRQLPRELRIWRSRCGSDSEIWDRFLVEGQIEINGLRSSSCPRTRTLILETGTVTRGTITCWR